MLIMNYIILNQSINLLNNIPPHPLLFIDASIIPFITNGNVHTTVLVIASMAVDFILNSF